MRKPTTVERVFPGNTVLIDSQHGDRVRNAPGQLRKAGFAFRAGWKCLDGGALTLDQDGKTFTTLEEARAHAKRAAYNNGDPTSAGGLGRRVFVTNATGAIFRSWRVRLGPDYMPQGHPTGWGLY